MSYWPVLPARLWEFPGVSCPLSSNQTDSGGQTNNGLAEFVSGPSNYNEVFIGLNSGPAANPGAVPPAAASFTTATYYIDNFTLTANPVPEPGAAGLALLAGLTMAAGRRRSA